MARHFSPKTFMIEAPNRLLKDYYESIGLGADIQWKYLGERDIDPIFETYAKALEPIRRSIDNDFREIHNLADEGGIKTLIEVGQSQFHNVDIISVCEGAEGHLERAFVVFLNHREVFCEASLFHYADKAGHWRKRKRLPRMLNQPDEESKARLANELSNYYRVREGRGYGCAIDYYKRDRRHYWYVYPEDYATSTLVYDEDHRLSKQTQRLAFEIIFVYSESECSLDIRANGPKKLIQDLQSIWGRSVLGQELGEPPTDSVVYELDALRDRDFSFALEPEDGVSEVRVRRLKIKVVGSDHQITIESPANRNPKSVYDVLERVIEGLGISDDMFNVVSAGIQLVFPGVGTCRPRTLTFDVSHPNSCSLKCEPRHEIAKNLLKRWKLDVSGDIENNADESGQSAQRVIQVR